MALRVTRVSAQVGGNVTGGKLRITRVASQVGGNLDSAKLRVTRLMAQVIGSIPDGDLELSQIIVQVGTTQTDEPHVFTSELGTSFSSLGTGTMELGVGPDALETASKAVTASSDVTFSQSAIEVAIKAITASSALTFVQIGELPPFSSTSIPGNINAVLGLGLTLGLDALLFDVSYIRTATNNITFSTDTASVEKTKPRTGNNTLTFTQTNTRGGEWSPTAGNTITFTQTNLVVVPKHITASNTLIPSQSVLTGTYSRTAHSDLSLAQIGRGVTPKDSFLTASSPVLFTHTVNPGLIARTAYNSVEFSQSNIRAIIGEFSVSLTVSSVINFTTESLGVRFDATGLVLTAFNTITFTHRGIFPIELTGSNLLTIVYSENRTVGKSANSILELTQVIIANHWRNLTATSAVPFQHSFTFHQLRGIQQQSGGILISPIDPNSCDITRQYAPSSGGDTSLIRPFPPALSRFTDVEFFYPSDQLCSSTYNMVLRTPNFGDRDRNQYNRINRESRGGSLRVYRDPKWPSQRTLVMDFSALKDEDVDNILAFLENTLGQRIGFRDWQGRQWVGIVANPESASIVRNGTDRNDIAIELEVDEQILDNQLCQVLSISQIASVVKVTP